MKTITTTHELADICARFAQFDFVTVDTEFIRETTYWPNLCLVQIAVENEEALIDPLAGGIDLAPFYKLMADETVVKVFHAARQDIEIMFNQSGEIPTPIFDTQVAAMVCGFGDSAGYGVLVKKILNRDIDKSSRYTDWAKRPLSPKQLHYALGDVTHLREVYLFLKDDIDRRKRESWLKEELRTLTGRETYDLQPEDAWRRVKQKARNKKAFSVMMALAEWRERSAQEQNVPRGRILKDDAINDIANHAPTSEKALAGLRSVHDGFARSKRGRDVLEAVQIGLDRDMDLVPEMKRGKPLPAEAMAVVELLRVLLKSAAAENAVAQRMIATAPDLEKIAVDDEADVPALSGWRRALFGQAALDLKHGTLALAVERGRLRLIPLENGAPDRS